MKKFINKNNYSSILLFAYAAILGFMSFSYNPFDSTFALAAMIVSAPFNKYLTLAIYLVTNVIGISFSSTEVFVELFVISAVGASVITERRFNFRVLAMFLITAFFAITMLIGLALGQESQMVTIILFAFNLFFVTFIAQAVINRGEKLYLQALLYAGIAVAISVGYLFIGGNAEDVILSETGRLQYQEGVKTLSTIIVIPTFWSIHKIINRGEGTRIWLHVAIFALCFPLLMLTYSRGVTIACILATILLLFFSRKKVSFGSVVTIVAFAALAYYIFVSLDMNLGKWTSSLEGGNGRTNIYKMYYDYMVAEGSRTMVWGIGSASQSYRFGWYPHSVILAHFFHFGIWGLLFVAYQLISPLVCLYRNKEYFFFCLLVLDAVMFSSHGSYGNSLYCMVLGLCMGVAYRYAKVPSVYGRSRSPLAFGNNVLVSNE